MNLVERFVRHQRSLVLAAVAVISGLAWVYIWDGAGMGMSARDMTSATLFPHLHPAVPGTMETSWTVIVPMWWVMMVGMMTPSAAPLVLLHGMVLRRHGQLSIVPALLVLGGYLGMWMLFSIGAAIVHQALQASGLISAMMLWSSSAALSALILAAAGAYQLSPLKRVCLHQCRDPASFLMKHWRPGPAGSVILGMKHGAYCVGCCWLLMTLLFVGGIMNLLWIAALMVTALLERLMPAADRFARISGFALLVWSAATLLS